MEEGISPAGHLPVLWIASKACPEHVSAMRLAAGLFLEQKEVWAKYHQDMLADAYSGLTWKRDEKSDRCHRGEWRADWAKVAFGGDEGEKEKYKTSVLARLKQFEGVLSKVMEGDSVPDL